MDETDKYLPCERTIYCVGFRVAGGHTALFARVGTSEDRARQLAAQLDAADEMRGRVPAHTVYSEQERIVRKR